MLARPFEVGEVDFEEGLDVVVVVDVFMVKRGRASVV